MSKFRKLSSVKYRILLKAAQVANAQKPLSLQKKKFMATMNDFCQSCSMPMAKDPQRGGTNADGSKSKMYCSYCFQNGKFIDNFTTAKEMQQFLRKKFKEQGFGPLRRWFYTSYIPRLERWKKK